MIRYIYVWLTLALIPSLVTADSELLGKVVNNEEICSLFYEGNEYIWRPKNVFVRSHFKSKKSEFDGDNDGVIDHIRLEEKFTTYQTNMMYFGYEKQGSEDYKYIFPQSWMTCQSGKSECALENKIKSGVLNIGAVPGKKGPVYYRSRYTNVFPFMKNGITYYKVTTESTNKDVVSILKPSAKNLGYEVVCAFHTGKKL